MKNYLIILLAALLFGCAQINQLSGGPSDEVAPQIDSAKTYPHNGQINFSEKEIVIKFDEYIKLVSPNDNILITPQPKKRPEIKAKNKKVKVTFLENLEENTTYSINFNRAVADITEQNDSIFQFVFSTGDYIDSLSIAGSVTDGFTNAAEKDFLIALYPENSEVQYDSIPYLLKPTYIGQSNQSGKFQLSYLKEGSYHLFAFRDVNKNMNLDPSEKIAIYEQKQIVLDSIVQDVQLKSFQIKDTVCRINDKRFTYPGKLEIILSSEPEQFSVTSKLDLMQEKTERPDSLIYWLSENPLSSMRFYTELNGEKDTIRPLFKGAPAKSNDRKPITITSNVQAGKLLPEENLLLTFSEPLKEVLPDVIRFFDVDSNRVEVKSKTENVRSMRFETFGKNIDFVQIDSAGLISVFGNTNKTHKQIIFENHDADYYGTVTILLDSVVQEKVLVELIDDKGKVVTDTVKYAKSMLFKELLPQQYQLRLIFDRDGNGEWTSGSLSEGRIPERVIYFSGGFKAKSKWEKEVEWSVSY